MIKHAHHSFDVDKPGKDSYRHAKPAAARSWSCPTGAGDHARAARASASLRWKSRSSGFRPCDLLLWRATSIIRCPSSRCGAGKNGKDCCIGRRAYRCDRFRRAARDEAAAIRSRRPRQHRGIHPRATTDCDERDCSPSTRRWSVSSPGAYPVTETESVPTLRGGPGARRRAALDHERTSPGQQRDGRLRGAPGRT